MQKLIVVTGSGRGLGYEIAESLAKAGHHMVIAEKRVDLAEEAAQKLVNQGLIATPVVTDISDKDSVAAMVQKTQELGGADALVNNAALADGVGGQAFWDVEETRFQEVMNVNAYGTWLVSKHLFSQLERKGSGAIVNMASDTALYGMPRLVHYVSSKGAVMAMTRSMARDAGEKGVRVNAVAPGLVRVEATETVPEERFDLYAAHRALNREQQPSDVVGAVEFLISDSAGFITGQTLVVDGGFVMNQ